MKTTPSPAFDATLPDDPVTPVVLSVPHAGISVDGFADELAPALDVRCDADLFVDELYAGAPRGSYVRASLSRFVCDLNRHPDDVSPRAVPPHPAPRNQDGRGFIWEVTTTGTPTLRRPLTLASWQARKSVHNGYYAAIKTGIDRARAKFGFAVLIDGHSMPSVGKTGHSDTGHQRADVVPGDRVGTSCAPGLSNLVSGFFVARGFRVAPNDPYRGGFITQHHGRPADGVHALQIELRRDLYMDESTFTRKAPAFDNLRATLAELMRVIDAWRPDHPQR